MSAAEAVRRAMPIHLFLAIVPEADEVFVNCGVLENYPVRLFDCAQYFAEQNRPRYTTNPKAYAEAKAEED